MDGSRSRSRWVLLLALSLSPRWVCAEGDFGEIDTSKPRWSLLRGVEKALQGTSQVVRGAGDALAVGAGSTIRIAGDGLRSVGGGLEHLGSSIGGERTGDPEDGGVSLSPSTGDPLDATRLLLSRPIRVLGSLVRTAGDATNFIGDTTGRLVGETIGTPPPRGRWVRGSGGGTSLSKPICHTRAPRVCHTRAPLVCHTRAPLVCHTRAPLVRICRLFVLRDVM